MESPLPDPTADDQAFLEEAFTGRPLHEPPATALARMRRELNQLRTDLAGLEGEDLDTQFARDIRADIHTLTNRIAEYEHQLGNQN